MEKENNKNNVKAEFGVRGDAAAYVCVCVHHRNEGYRGHAGYTQPPSASILKVHNVCLDLFSIKERNINFFL